MSYILDALKKSDEEHKQQQMPGLHTNHGGVYFANPKYARQKRRRQLLFRIMLAAPLVLCLFGTLFYHLYKDEQLTGQTNTNVTAQQPPSLQTPEISQRTDRRYVSEAPVPSPAEVDAVVINQTAIPSPMLSDPAGQHNRIYLARDKVKLRLAVPETPDDQRPKSDQTRTDVQIALSPVPSRDVGSTIPQHNGQTEEQIPLREELLPEIRAELPELKFVGHTYSELPEQRMIIINSKILRESERISPGLVLKTIIWNGVILTFHGVDFKVILE